MKIIDNRENKGKIMLKLLFFGRLAEVVGAAEMSWGMVGHLGELEAEVRARYGELEGEGYRLAVNARFVVGEVELKEGDEIAFMPAFSGG